METKKYFSITIRASSTLQAGLDRMSAFHALFQEIELTLTLHWY